MNAPYSIDARRGRGGPLHNAHYRQLYGDAVTAALTARVDFVGIRRQRDEISGKSPRPFLTGDIEKFN
ncbi:MAG: hypothetical protein ABR878_02925 [Roseiarcus sp.]